MDARLAQVRALVDERWRGAQEKRLQNDHLAQRVEVLTRLSSSKLLPTRVKNNADLATTEKQIAEADKLIVSRQQQLVMRKEQLRKLESVLQQIQRQRDDLQQAVDLEKAHAEEMWAEMMADVKVLQEQDKCIHAHKNHEKAKEFQVIKELQQQLVELCVAAEKSHADQTLKTAEGLKRHKRSLDEQLHDATVMNESLKKRITTERAKRRPGQGGSGMKASSKSLEQRVDSILRDLNAMGE